MAYLKGMSLPFCRIAGDSCGSPPETASIAMTATAFVVYKHNPNDPGSLSSNFIEDLLEDDHGYLWISTNTGVNKFDPISERFTRYLHDPNNPNTIGGAYVTRIARDSRGYLWFGTQDSGLDKFDPATGTFTHYRNDSDGQFVGRITHVSRG